MTGRALAVQGGLAALGLVVAYTTWQREPEGAIGDVLVVDATKGEVKGVHFEDDNVTVDVDRASTGGEEGAWLRLKDKTPAVAVPPPAKPGQPPPPAPPKAKDKPLRELRGDEAADKLLAQFAPFRSPRAFGVLDDKKMKELGLDTSKKKLVVDLRGGKREFSIGQPPQGNGESYLRDTKDGRIFLMPRSILSDLQGASFRLVDKKLHVFKMPDVNRMTIASAGKTRTFTVVTPPDLGYKLMPASTPDKADEMARNWHDRIWHAFPTEVLGKGEAPAGGEPKVLARIEYFDGAKSLGWLELGKGGSLESTDGSMSAPPLTDPAGGDLYARSEHTAGWVKIRNDPGTLAEAEKIAATP